MNQLLRHAVVFSLLAGTSFAQSDGDVAADLKKLKGTWTLVRETADGADKPAAELRGIKLIFTADAKWRVEKDNKVVGAGGLSIDPLKKPKTIDYTFTQGELQGKQFTAIYEVSADTFRHCGVMEGARPGDFS